VKVQIRPSALVVQLWAAPGIGCIHAAKATGAEG